jgi:Ca2+-binding RTX toxin-like protein
MTARTMGRLAVILGATCALAAGEPAAAYMPCTYDAVTRTVSAVATPEPAPDADNAIYRAATGEILTNTAGNAATSCGAATVDNTDTILVTDGSPTGDSGVGSPTIATDLAPGFTDEPGTSDEIEITVDLGAGSDGIFLFPGDRTAPTPDDSTPQWVTLGSPAPGTGSINLYAGENGGADTDIALAGVEVVSMFLARDIGDAAGNSDLVVADGSGGAGGVPFAARLNVDAGPGSDVVIGGSGNDDLEGGGTADQLEGGAGIDELDGGGGGDELNAGPGDDSYVIGAQGNDLLRGGSGSDRRLLAGPNDDAIFGNGGADKLFGENGNDELTGGSGRDRCDAGAGKGDRILTGCETVRQGDG